MGASEATTTSKMPRRSNWTSDLKSVTPITYLSMCILFIWYGPFLAASEATTASKQPRRSKLSVQVKLVTPIYYMTKFQGTFISQISLMSGGEGDKHDPLTCVASPQVIKFDILAVNCQYWPKKLATATAATATASG